MGFKFENYSTTDRDFWKSEKVSGDALVKFAVEEYEKNGASELMGDVLVRKMELMSYLQDVMHEVRIAKKYIKEYERQLKEFKERTGE